MVRITQLKCPNSHCLIAVAYQEGTQDPAAVSAGIWHTLRTTPNLNARCGICGSTELHIDDGATAYRTMAEAEPHLRASAEQQRATKALLDATGLSWDARRKAQN
jgi:hypothetical protein